MSHHFASAEGRTYLSGGERSRGRLAGLKLRPTREAEIIEELAQHLEDRYSVLLARGATGALGGYTSKRLLASQYFASSSWQRQRAEQLYGVELTNPVTFAVIASLTSRA